MFILIVHFTQRTHYMQYIMGNSYLPDCRDYVFSVTLLLCWCPGSPPSIARKCFFYSCLCNACTSCPKSLGKTHIYVSVLLFLPLSCSQYCSQCTLSTILVFLVFRFRLRASVVL